MGIIKQSDFIQSIEHALQFISYYHPVDFIESMTAAYEREENPAAKAAMRQILINSRMSAEGHRPMCQDTGIVCVYVYVGMEAKWDTTELSIQEMIDEGTRRAYANADNPLRASIVEDPLGTRKNTGDNTPASVNFEVVKGDKVEVSLSAKGGGSEFKSKFEILNPRDSLVDWVLHKVPTMGAGWCPPGILGIGVGGTAEKAMYLAKECLNDPIDMPELLKRGPKTRVEELRIEIYNKVNGLGIGAQGLGGLTTVLDVKISDFPTHIACLPVAMVPSCASTRHAHFSLDGSGAAEFTPPSLDHWPKLDFDLGPSAKKVNIDNISQAEIETWTAGDTLLLSGTMLTGRDAAHFRMQQMLENGEELPVDMKGKFIYYVGPVKAVREEIIGPAGPTTATRMDKFTDMMLDKVGVMGMIGKSERSVATAENISKHKKVYLMAVGGAAYLIAKAIKSAKVIAFEDLGTEAIHEFVVEDMPVTVGVDTHGNNIHVSGPAKWKNEIAGIQVRSE